MDSNWEILFFISTSCNCLIELVMMELDEASIRASICFLLTSYRLSCFGISSETYIAKICWFNVKMACVKALIITGVPQEKLTYHKMSCSLFSASMQDCNVWWNISCQEPISLRFCVGKSFMMIGVLYTVLINSFKRVSFNL